MGERAVKYKAEICEGSIAWAHGFTETIDEVFVYDHNIVFNEKGFVFFSEAPRSTNQPEEIELDRAFVYDMKNYIELKKDIDKNISTFFGKEIK
jgi:hypothetical protein